ncbi:methyltransferase family protein [Flavobacterium terrisoli]|uniref:methyltransferase family protein n=1 Tax=Flavobacterium terrisoli TaxID=3242195 RepID=UPI00254275B5|nr:isoprenylcysteine carboxylmethyltransferase family protein [Flavobacterium buctense]
MALLEDLERQSTRVYKYWQTLPSVMLIIGYFVLIDLEKLPHGLFLKQSPYENIFEGICLGISILGLIIRIIIIGYTPSFTEKNSKGTAIQYHYNLGAYSIVRHPLLLADLIIWIGMIAITGDFWFIISFGLLYILYLERIILAKEKRLKSKFGFKYSRWAEGVPAFIPNIWLYRKANGVFGWRKIFRSEMLRFSRILFVFFTFEILGKLSEEKKKVAYAILVLSIICAVINFIIKRKSIITYLRRLLIKLLN